MTLSETMQHDTHIKKVTLVICFYCILFLEVKDDVLYHYVGEEIFHDGENDLSEHVLPDELVAHHHVYKDNIRIYIRK